MRPNEKAEASLLKILIPKKVVKLATGRNRLRRLIKEALRLRFLLEKEKMYVFRAVKNPGEVGLAETKEMLNVLLQKS